MKIKNTFYLTLFSLTFFSCIISATSIVPSTEDFTSGTPLEFSLRSLQAYLKTNSSAQDLATHRDTNDYASGIFNQIFSSYITNIYNKTGYGKVLSQNGDPIIEILDFCNDLSADSTSVYVCIRLLYNKFKSAECEIIDDTVINQLLQTLPKLLERHFVTTEPTQQENLDFLRRNTEEMMLSSFINGMPEFQKTPDTFITNLSSNVLQIWQKEIALLQQQHQKSIDQAEMRARLRSIVIRFFDLLLNKSIWTFQSYEGIWSSFINTANNLFLLANHSIIDHMDDLDDLQWSLVHRFAWFLDFAGAALPSSFYEEIESDLNNNLVAVLETPEQDPGITTKKETLLRALAIGRTKSVAQEKGIMQIY